jgi:hypothetical protein
MILAFSDRGQIDAVTRRLRCKGAEGMTEQNVRTVILPVGITSVGVRTVQRQISDDEPPALPPNSELAVIGKAWPRPDGRTKVTGAMRFTVRHLSSRHAPRARAALTNADS